jgi:putative membrane protein
MTLACVFAPIKRSCIKVVAAEPLSPEELILRDHLAIDRTRLANERTLLAYMRTSLMLLVAGATAVKLIDVNRSILITGWIFLVSGVIVGTVGIWRFLAMRHAINRRDHQPP